MIAATKASNRLPGEGDDFEYYSSFPGFKTFCDKMGGRANRMYVGVYMEAVNKEIVHLYIGLASCYDNKRCRVIGRRVRAVMEWMKDSMLLKKQTMQLLREW